MTITIDEVIEELRAELKGCPATPKGYREAAWLREHIANFKRWKEVLK